MKIRKLLFTGLIALFTAGLLLLPGFSSLIHGSSNKVAAQPIPTINFSAANFPNIAPNIQTAQNNGAPAVLTRDTDTSAIRRRRNAACANIPRPRPPGQQCDEYPFASTLEGGAGARAILVPRRENSSQGGRLANFFTNNNVNDGDQFQVTTSP